MAQAYIICTCTTCGKEFTKTKTCKNRSEADSFEKWAKENIDTCPDCYKKIRRKQEAEKGLLVEYTIDLDAAYHGKLCEVAVFSGDTYNQRAKLKDFGCKCSFGQWRYLFPVTPEVNKDTEMEARIESELGAKKTGYNRYERQFKDALKIIDAYNKKMEEKQKELDALGEKPSLPEEFVSLRNGRKWNGTIYGYNADKSVYFDGEKTAISSDLAKKVTAAMEQKKQWSDRKNEIEKKYQ